MATVRMISCDNPQCNSVGAPEWERQPGERRNKGKAAWSGDVAPPYGWIHLTGGWMGCGPSFQDMMVCSIECAAPALDRVRELDRD